MKRYPNVEEKRAHALKRMKDAESAMGDEARFVPVANNMAAGPCEGCLAIEGRSYRADDAPLMPLNECPHPDQCVGTYRLKFDF